MEIVQGDAAGNGAEMPLAETDVTPSSGEAVPCTIPSTSDDAMPTLDNCPCTDPSIINNVEQIVGDNTSCTNPSITNNVEPLSDDNTSRTNFPNISDVTPTSYDSPPCTNPTSIPIAAPIHDEASLCTKAAPSVPDLTPSSKETLLRVRDVPSDTSTPGSNSELVTNSATNDRVFDTPMMEMVMNDEDHVLRVDNQFSMTGKDSLTITVQNDDIITDLETDDSNIANSPNENTLSEREVSYESTFTIEQFNGMTDHNHCDKSERMDNSNTREENVAGVDMTRDFATESESQKGAVTHTVVNGCGNVDGIALHGITSLVAEYRSDGSESSDSSSDSDSSTSSVSSVEIKEKLADSDEERAKTFKPKTRGEKFVEDLPPIEDLCITVDEETPLVPFGKVTSIVGLLIVIQSEPDTAALDMDSVIFTVDRKSLGQVFETFGPVKSPFYSIRFNSVEQMKEKGVEVGMTLYCAPSVPDYTHFVFMTDLLKLKGSDASWEDNNEPPVKFLDYSDDEQERVAKKGKKRSANKRKDQWPPEEEGDSDDSSMSFEKNASRRNVHRGGGNVARGAVRENYPRLWRPRPPRAVFGAPPMFQGRPGNYGMSSRFSNFPVQQQGTGQGLYGQPSRFRGPPPNPFGGMGPYTVPWTPGHPQPQWHQPAPPFPRPQNNYWPQQ